MALIKENYLLADSGLEKRDRSKEWGPLGLTLLYSPSQTHANIIFVHGLRGGSYRTWRNGDDQDTFWPQAWLPQDTEFQNTRIYTFGYDSDWTDGDSSILNIHDFGRSLFSELNTSPQFQKDEMTPIILVGHSMGGLVIKKAYTLTRQDPYAERLASRIQAIFFIATPHKGSDSAKLLNKVLRATGLFKPFSYVADLMRNSPSLQVVSDEFEKYAEDVRLWSFYETRKMRLGLVRRYIVDKESAILGYKNESVQLLNADHREAARFDSPTHPNFQRVRNALACTVTMLIDKWARNKHNADTETIRTLATYLSTSNYHIEDLEDLEDAMTKGTCCWLEKRADFQKWLADESRSRQLYWLAAPPGTGKSVLAAHLVRYIQSQGHRCVYYFFKSGDRVKQASSSFLLSLSYQLSTLNQSIRELLLSMHKDGLDFDKGNDRAIWRALFTGQILDIPIASPQYVIIDGIDECSNASNLMAMLGKIESKFPVRILVTSRPTLEFRRHFLRWEDGITHYTISDADLLPDIRTHLAREAECLPISNPRKREKLIDQIIFKSRGNFLWVRLVLQEMGQAISEEQVREVLDNVPVEMESLYQRSIERISKDFVGKELIHSILTWVACASRPLTAIELQAALVYYMDKPTTIEFNASLEYRCGHFVSFRKSSAVEMVHATAREFLLSKKNTAFPIAALESHTRLTIACLKNLTTNEMEPVLNCSDTEALHYQPKSEFVDYASVGLSGHVSQASPDSGELMGLLIAFFQSNVLTWIQYILQYHDIPVIVETGRNLSLFLERPHDHSPSARIGFQYIHRWARDLIRVASKFGAQMKTFPEASLYTVPPLCPSSSAIYQQFKSIAGVIKLEGSHSIDWEDCVAWITYRDTYASSITSGGNRFALGTYSGEAFLYDQTTCQNTATFQHGEPVKALALGYADRYLLASAGPKNLKLWAMDGSQIWSYSPASPCIDVTFSPDSRRIVVVTRPHSGIQLNVEDGTPIRDHTFTGSSEILSVTKDQVPIATSISPDASILAIVYRGRAIHLWSLQKETKLIGFCGRNTSNPFPGISPLRALFNPDPNTSLLAVSFEHGEVALYDPQTQEELACFDCFAFAMAATSDGKILATADGHGMIELWDFQTPKFLYRISSYEAVNMLVFSGDGSRIVDARSTFTQIWEPPVMPRLIQDGVYCEMSKTGKLDTEIYYFDIFSQRLETIVFHPHEPVLFAARGNSEIVACSGTSRWEATKLYTHSEHIHVTQLLWTASTNKLFSADMDGIVIGRQLEQKDGKWMISRQGKLTIRTKCIIRQLLFNYDGSMFLVSGDFGIAVRIHLEGEGKPKAIRATINPVDSERKWLSHPDDPSKLILLIGAEFRLYEWDTLRQIGRFSLGDVGNDLPLKSHGSDSTLHLLQATVGDKTYIVMGRTIEEAHKSGFPFYIWESSVFVPNSTIIAPVAKLRGVKHFLGFLDAPNSLSASSHRLLIFLDQDLWVCSYDLTTILRGKALKQEKTQYQRHFFIPREYTTQFNGLTACLSSHGDIAFARGKKVTVVKCDWKKLMNRERA